MLDYDYKSDIELVRGLRNLSFADIARNCGLSEKTLKRWVAGESAPSSSSLETFYNYAHDLDIPLNVIKSHFYQERFAASGRVALFHGSRSGIEGNLSLEKCLPGNDFGRGFYCGESLEQSALFVANHRGSSLYVVDFDPKGLRCESYAVNRDWMLTIAVFRGRLDEYADHPHVKALVDRVRGADYIVAPIADNRMYEIISEFIDGITTDAVCEHCLSATQLGNQYVFLTEQALSQVRLVERCFLAQGERRRYGQQRKNDLKAAEDKVKAAKRLFRKEGRYIDELLS